MIYEQEDTVYIWKYIRLLKIEMIDLREEWQLPNEGNANTETTWQLDDYSLNTHNPYLKNLVFSLYL